MELRAPQSGRVLALRTYGQRLKVCHDASISFAPPSARGGVAVKAFSVASAAGLEVSGHTPSIAFRHLPPNSARFGYATEGVLFISAQLSSDAVSALRKVPVLI